MLHIANLPLTIQSTMNHHFHVFSAKIMLVIASLSYNGLIQVKEERWTGFPEEQPCQPEENPLHPNSFTWIYILLEIRHFGDISDIFKY